jgi:primosomal protein N' (replication factor Y)
MNFFTYSSDEMLNAGDLVEVNLRKKVYKAVVWRKVGKPKFKTLPVVDVLMQKALKDWQMRLIEFIANYYFANIGTTLDLFLPKKLKDNVCKLEPYSGIFKGDLFDESALHKLSELQSGVLDDVLSLDAQIGLLHGVTGSGKTEVYMHWIVSVLKSDPTAQILLLVPEISLTPQMQKYLLKIFPKDIVSIYNSKMNKSEQLLEWKKVYAGETRIVVGSRSSLFLPFQNLKAVIVDEEHDSAYKQEQDPKYHVRQIVQKMNSTLGINVLLGSATPSVETYNAAKNGKIQYFTLDKKAMASGDLEYLIVDMKDERKRGNWHYLSDSLVESITSCLEKGEQVMLLHNRRGSASFLQCVDCGKVEECVNCSISLTPHGGGLLCHYCNYKKDVPMECSFCGSVDLKSIGVGVKGLEEELKKFFPDYNIVRIDSDTNSRKNAHVENYEKLHGGEADIIVGTQTIATGLDIENVGLVGVVNVDQHLNFPDFRANERSFQLLTQFAGRAGRGKVKGKVVLQTYQDDSVVVRSIVDESYSDYVSSELEYRRMLRYPPFNKMTRLIYSHKDQKVVSNEAARVVGVLDHVGYKTYKSSPPLIERKHSKYYHQIILFDLNPKKLIEYLDLPKGWSVDRDPISMI